MLFFCKVIQVHLIIFLLYRLSKLFPQDPFPHKTAEHPPPPLARGNREARCRFG